ncbi:carbohydrate ABC transporter permease [uncultured Cellulomonas sp.]|uniref:carbohydrate ABC transporter permease n=1 Tax=uncultured Cellulomonas sp. TaxID=189682 RepID=UPI00262FB1A7|nr:sugar ABC transporter permease [uncultured Cellulomonas sp.]
MSGSSIVQSSPPTRGLTPSRPSSPAPRRSRQRRELLVSLALLAPAAAVIVLLMAVPLVTVVADSFTDRSFISPTSSFVGFENYSDVLTGDAFWPTWSRTLLWTGVSVFFQIAIGLAFAMLLNQRFRGRGGLRAIFLLPWITPVVVVALIWKWMLNDLYGIINNLLGAVRPEWGDLAWFSDQSLALATVIGVNVWRGVPFTMIILLAGLQSVPGELVEAASVDGAGRLRTFATVTLPHLRGILLTVALIFTMFNFNNFDLIYLGTRGGPGDQTMILPVKTYDVAFNGLQVGESGAWATLTLITIAVIAGIYFAYMRRREAKH